MGTDTVFGRPCPEERGQARYSGARAFCRDLSMHLPAQIRGQTRCSIYRSGTFNVKRSTPNFQRGDRKAAWWPGYGNRHGVLPVGGANRGTDTVFGPGRQTLDPPDLTKRRSDGRGQLRHPDMGTDTKFQIWGQTRCPVCRSGTLNVQRSTLNFQRGDRKGAWWPGCGDRHDVWGLTEQIEGQTRYLARLGAGRRARVTKGLRAVGRG